MGADEVSGGVMAASHCHSQWRWWSKTLWVTLTRLWPVLGGYLNLLKLLVLVCWALQNQRTASSSILIVLLAVPIRERLLDDTELIWSKFRGLFTWCYCELWVHFHPNLIATFCILTVAGLNCPEGDELFTKWATCLDWQESQRGRVLNTHLETFVGVSVQSCALSAWFYYAVCCLGFFFKSWILFFVYVVSLLKDPRDLNNKPHIV